MTHLTCVTADPADTPSTTDRRTTRTHPAARPHLVLVREDPRVEPAELGSDAAEDGSLVAEYGLLAVVAATVAGVLISWAGSGALATFFGQLLNHARSLVVG